MLDLENKIEVTTSLQIKVQQERARLLLNSEYPGTSYDQL